MYYIHNSYIQYKLIICTYDYKEECREICAVFL